MANLTDAADPAVHLLLRFGHQVKSAKRRLHHKEVLPVEVPLYPQLPVQHFHLTLLQVDDTDRLLGVLALIVLQHVGIAAHATSPQHEPALPPRLQEKGTNSCLLDFYPYTAILLTELHNSNSKVSFLPLPTHPHPHTTTVSLVMTSHGNSITAPCSQQLT